MSTIENTPEEWDEEYDEAAIDAQKATAEIRESQDVVLRLAQGRRGLSQKDVDYLGLSWWRHTDGIEASLAMLGGRLAQTNTTQVARAWNELVSAVGQMGKGQEHCLERFLDLVASELTDDVGLLASLNDNSNPNINALDVFYGDHLRVSWPAIDAWLGGRGRTQDQETVATAAIFSAIGMAMRDGPQDPLEKILARLPKGDPANECPLVHQWLCLVNRQSKREHVEATLDCLVAHGADLDAPWQGKRVMEFAGTYLAGVPERGDYWEDPHGTLWLLIDRGADWLSQREGMGEKALDSIQKHPAVVAGQLLEMANRSELAIRRSAGRKSKL